MRAIIIEDEKPAADRLARLLHKVSEEVDLVKRLDSVAAAVQYFREAEQNDLVFMDIQLADGLSFDIFYQVEIKAPVIFTTAFDQYTLKAFKVNSIDYLLKPIDEEELRMALEKYLRLYQKKETFLSENILKMVQGMNTTKYRERLLVKRGQQLGFLKTESIAFCYADGKLCFAVEFNSNRHLLETTLSQLEEHLHPRSFFRVNRHLLVNIDAIKKVHTWLGGRLKLELSPATSAETVVSRERVNDFKDWLGQ
jgi:DNA-binding LytR/AlgR family response regulator